MVKESQIKDQIEISKSYEKMQGNNWINEATDYDYHAGYVYALKWVLGKVKARYNKEDI
tara:strand:- start:47 stop:223 length:177 start_codon:yes stop_codon:yes gene_type:complete